MSCVIAVSGLSGFYLRIGNSCRLRLRQLCCKSHFPIGLASDVRRRLCPAVSHVPDVGLRPCFELTNSSNKTVSGRSPIQLSQLVGGAKPPPHIRRQSRNHADALL